MHKFLSLTRVTLKSTMGMVSDGKSKKTAAVLIYIVLGVSIIPLAGLLFFMFQSAFDMFQQLDQSGTVLAVAFYLASFITFFFSIFLIPSIFYFSKDGETLLSLPIRPETILGSKFVVCLFYEYAFTLVVLLPAFAAYMTIFSVSIITVIFALIILLLLPIYPLVLSSIISMLIMRFVPFFKNRDRFNLIAGIVSVVAALAFSFSFNSMTMTSNDTDAIVNLLMSGNNSMISMLGNFFPNASFAAHALIDGDIVQMFIFIAISAASLLLCLLIGKAIYFKGLIGFSETGSSRKKLSDKDMGKIIHKKNRILTYAIKELKLLIRTPIYFMNCIGTSLIFPILVFLMPMFESEGLNADMIPAEFTSMLNEFWPYMLIGGIILGFFIGNLNMISASAISREGTNVYFMKFIPMPLKDQLHAKVLSGIVVSVVTDILMLAAFCIVFPILPIHMILLIFVTSLVGVVLCNYIGIYFDILHPKLVWEQEAAAVKQNMSAAVAMLGGMAIAVLIGVAAVFTPYTFIPYASIGILLLMIIATVILYRSIGRVAQKAFAKY